MPVDVGRDGIAATYNDGRTARRIAVSVSLLPGHLEIADEAGRVLDRWPFSVIAPLPPAGRGDPWILRGGADGAARLTLRDDTLLDRMRAAGAGLRPSGDRSSGSTWRFAALLLAAAASIAIVLFGLLPLLARQVAAVMPRHLEESIGDRYVDLLAGMLADDKGGARICSGVDGRAALDRLVARLQAVAQVSPPPRVSVVAGGRVNAFAVPGSRLIVMRGLIEAVDGPDELAAVLAHEIAHAVHRHPTEAAIRHGAGGFVIGLVLGDAVGISVIGSVARQLIDAAHSREAESEADSTGLRLLEAAGLSADGFARFMTRMAQERRATSPGLLSYLDTHPPGAARAARAGGRTGGDSAMTPVEWEAVRRICGQR